MQVETDFTTRSEDAIPVVISAEEQNHVANPSASGAKSDKEPHATTSSSLHPVYDRLLHHVREMQSHAKQIDSLMGYLDAGASTSPRHQGENRGDLRTEPIGETDRVDVRVTCFDSVMKVLSAYRDEKKRYPRDPKDIACDLSFEDRETLSRYPYIYQDAMQRLKRNNHAAGRKRRMDLESTTNKHERNLQKE